MTPDYNRAATLAALTLQRLKVTATPVLPEELIKACRNTKLLLYKDYCELPGIKAMYPDACSEDHPEATTIRYEVNGKTAWIVVYDPKKMPGDRYKFSLAHELGHIVMGHRGNDEAEEREADFFAAHLLIPRPVIAGFLERGKIPYEVNLVNLFNVSRSCLYTIQDSHEAYVSPLLNRALREQFEPFIAEFCESMFCHEKPMPHITNRYINTRCYMQGYQE